MKEPKPSTKSELTEDQKFMRKIAHLGPRVRNKLVRRRVVKAKIKAKKLHGLAKKTARQIHFKRQ